MGISSHPIGQVYNGQGPEQQYLVGPPVATYSICSIGAPGVMLLNFILCSSRFQTQELPAMLFFAVSGQRIKTFQKHVSELLCWFAESCTHLSH